MLHHERLLGAAMLAATTLFSNPGLCAGPLTLAEAERLAVDNDPLVARLAARAEALHERAVADGELPDPRLRLGLANLPTDTLNLNQEPVTQLQIGMAQALPRGDSLALESARTGARGDAEEARRVDQSLKALRGARNAYLELYFQIRAGEIVQGNRALFAQLAKITEAYYAAGRQRQQDAVRAQLELSRLDDRAERIRLAEDRARADLARWVGEAQAARPVEGDLPRLPPPPDRERMAEALARHPLMRAEDATVRSADLAVSLAGEAYEPGFQIEVGYAFRQGRNANGSDRADFLSAGVSMDLPLFPDRRQDRRLAASQREAAAARYGRTDRLRALRRDLDADHAAWRRLGERERLYREALLREASLNTRASLSAYQSGVADFTVLMRARITDLETQLDALRIAVDRAKANARLLYLLGDQP